MKRFISILLVFFFVSTTHCYAVSELYYIKNIKSFAMEQYVQNSYLNHDFNLVKKNPYYGLSKNNEQSVVVIIQQSGDNMFYYHKSDNNTKINKSILKELKRQGLVVEQSFNTGLIEVYDNLAKEVASETVTLKTYNFDEPQTPTFEPTIQTEQVRPQSNVYKGYVAQLAEGTKIQAYLQNAINTATATKGDNVVAVLTNALTYNGMEIAPQGSLLYGSLSKARPATYGSRNGRVVINFNQLVTPENKVYDISAEEIDFTVSNEGKVGNAVMNAAGAALTGAVAGLLIGLISRSDHVWQKAAVGAGVAAGSSAIYSTVERGVDAEIPSFTEIEITLTQPLSINVGY